MLAVGNTKPACQTQCVCASLQDNLKATAPYMGARRMKQTVLRRLYQGSALQQPAPQDIMTGLQTARNMQTMSSAQTAPQATVQQISQWWEQQWHVQQGAASQSRLNDQQSLRHQQRRQHQHLLQQQQQQQQQQYQLQQKQGHNQQQQQRRQYQLQQQQAHTQLQQQQEQYQLQQQLPREQLQKHSTQQQLEHKQHVAEHRHGIPHTQPALTGTTPRQAATPRTEASSKRRRARPNIVSAAAAAPGRAASLRATRNFKAVLEGNRFRKMDSGAELLAQAHTLQSLEHAAAEQAFQQRLHLTSQQPQLDRGVADAGSDAVPSTQASDSESTQAAQSDQSQLSAPETEGEIALARQQRAAAAQQDMMAVALDVVESQLPLWSSKPTLDWSAQQHLSKFRSQAKMSGTSDSSLPILTKFTLEERGEQVEVQPVWLLVHQEHPGGPARLYETVHTVYPEVLEHITTAVEPLCYAEGMTFSKPKFRHGPWKGYLVGAVGDVAASEDDALWPNRLFCDKRVMHNVRNSWDIAKFLAEPTMADMAGHHANLKLIQEDRHYQPRWVGRMLSSRWGKDAAAAYFASRQAVQSLQPVAQSAVQVALVHVSLHPRKLQHA